MINLDPKTLGLEKSSTTEVLKDVVNLNVTNSTKVDTKENNVTADSNTSAAAQ